jgi:beta-glucosidase
MNRECFLPGFCFLLTLPALSLGAQTTSQLPVYLQPRQPVEERVSDLLNRMTLKEKVGQLNVPAVYVDGLGKEAVTKMEGCRKFAAGTLTQEIGPAGGFFTLADTVLHDGAVQQAEFFNQLQKIALTQTRLKIPLLQDEEGTHGAMFSGATIFPEGLALGSTFDPDLIESIYAASAQEARSVGIHMLSTLVMELDRDPRMGRNMEAYTEDPYLDSRLAASIVHGAQGRDVSAPDKTIAVLTDFPTQSEPASGLERGAIDLSERALREDFMPPWNAGITGAGALGVMAGYSAIDDVPAHSSRKWMTQVLREEMGFQGLVESEGGGFQTLIDEDIVPTQKEAGALALWAGVDLNITYEPAYMGLMVENVEEGKVPVSLLDQAVSRVLRQKFRLGLFENPYVDPARAATIVHSKAHQDLSLDAAHEEIVLLKNEKAFLPLRSDLESIAVIGPNADNVLNQLGDYTAKHVTQPIVTVLAGIKAHAGPHTRVLYARGCDVQGTDVSGFKEAIRIAKAASVAVVVVGEQMGVHPAGEERATDGETHDVATLQLTGKQEDLVREIYATGTPVVLVLVNGRPLSIGWEAEHLPGIVEAWTPGEHGGTAVADVLFGDFNPSGKLAITIPRSVGQLPAYYNYKPGKEYWLANRKESGLEGYVDMPGTPLFPFGFGLSFTRFQYSNLAIESPRIQSGASEKVHVEVANVGDRPGTEVVQLYLHERFAPVSTAVKQLRGFARVTLKAGEKKTITFTLLPNDLSLLDRNMHQVIFPGTFDVMVGSSSADILLKDSFQVESSSMASVY